MLKITEDVEVACVVGPLCNYHVERMVVECMRTFWLCNHHVERMVVESCCREKCLHLRPAQDLRPSMDP